MSTLKNIGMALALVASVGLTGSVFASPALKKLAGETRELAGRIDTVMGNIEKSVKEVEEGTNAIKDKGDTAAIADVNRRLEGLKGTTAKLDDEVDNLRKLVIKMEKALEAAKK
ncbi:MAG: hypothetical protein ACKO6N_08100 [Myxococcota bacterium]